MRIENDDGMVPFILFSKNDKYCSCVRLDNDGGIDPVNALRRNSREVSSVRLEKVDGMDPIKSSPANDMCVICVMSPISLGIVNPNVLSNDPDDWSKNKTSNFFVALHRAKFGIERKSQAIWYFSSLESAGDPSSAGAEEVGEIVAGTVDPGAEASAPFDPWV